MRTHRRIIAVATTLLAAGSLLAAIPALGERAGSGARADQAARLDAGLNHTCAIAAAGGVWCWGSDEFGQLGDDPTFGAAATSQVPLPVALPAGRTATAIAAGDGHTCAILDDGAAWCWGKDEQGQLGNDIQLASSGLPVHVPMPSGRLVTSISAANRHSCATLDDGTVWCWGTEGSGEIGDGDEPFGDQPTPAQVALPVGLQAVRISTGNDHTCAMMRDGAVWCWGSDSVGQLGTDVGDPAMGQPQLRVQPVQTSLPAGTAAVALSSGRATTCAILTTGAAWCWGADFSGQLGNNAQYESKTTPQPVTLLRSVEALSTSSSAAGEHSCALWGSGSVACWGQDDRGQLGDGDVGGSVPVPVGIELPGGRTGVAVVTGGSHTCATLDDGSVVCWGHDERGQLGNGAAGPVALAGAAPAALGPGTQLGRVVDVSVAAQGLPARLRTGRTATVTVSVRNAGPDTATGVRVALRAGGGMRILRHPSVLGRGTALSWQPGPIGPGGEAKVVLTVISQAPGSATVTAEVVAATQFDADSVPNDRRAGADDLATATSRVSGPRRVVLARVGVAAGAAGSRVAIRALSVSNIVRDDTIAVRCVRGCRFARTTLSNGARANLTSLVRRLRPVAGATIEVRVTSPGAIGRSVRLTLRPGAVTRRECRIQLNGRLTNCVAR